MTEPELKTTTYNEDFPDGFKLTLPVTGQTVSIYLLLKHGVNTKLTLEKARGGRVEYELGEESD